MYVIIAFLAFSCRVIIFLSTANPAQTKPTPINKAPVSLNRFINALTSAASNIIINKAELLHQHSKPYSIC